MKIKVLGAGAMGSIFGGRLMQAGADVELLATNQAHRDAINQHGLAMDLDEGQFTVPIKAIEPSQVTGPADLVILFTKTTQSKNALNSISGLLGDASAPKVMTAQNGLGNREIVSQFVAPDRVIYGMSTTPADLVAPGKVASHGEQKTAIMSGDDIRTPFLDELAALMNKAGLPCEVDENVQANIWQKVAFNSAMNALPAVTRTTARQLAETPEALAFARDLATETCEVARASGVPIDAADVHALMAMACEKHPDHKCSMLQDLLAGRPTEIDSINGAIVRAGKEVGVAVPKNEMMVKIIRLTEKSPL